MSLGFIRKGHATWAESVWVIYKLWGRGFLSEILVLESINSSHRVDSVDLVGPSDWIRMRQGGIVALKQGLFRKEALDAQHGQWLGAIYVASPVSRWLLSCVALAIAFGIMGILIFGYYTRRERVEGTLVPASGLLNIRASVGGVITRLPVKVGERVHKGDSLLEISRDIDSAALGDTRSRISQQLHSQRAELLSSMSLRTRSTYIQESQVASQIKLFRKQLARIDVQTSLQQRDVVSKQHLLKRIQPLEAKGYVSAFQIQQQQELLLTARAQIQALARQRVQVEQQISEASQKLKQLPIDLAFFRSSTKRDIEGIDQKLAQNESQRAVVLRAPRDGTVASLLVNAGQSVTSGQALLDVIPKSSLLKARLLVPSRAIGFIVPGCRVVLRYQAYPYQKYGQFYGQISDISKSALSPADISQLAGKRSNQPLYQVDVKLDRQYVNTYGKEQALKPGMVLSADVLLDQRRLIEWVFEPLYGMHKRISGGGKKHG